MSVKGRPVLQRRAKASDDKLALYAREMPRNTKPPASDEARRFGVAVAARRRMLGKSAEAAALDVEMSQSAWVRIELGRRHPTLDTICKVSRSLQCAPSQLLTEAGL